jgi:hypothetical protein
MAEKLEVTNKTGNDFELQMGALKRRKALVQEEKKRCETKSSDSERKLTEYQEVSSISVSQGVVGVKFSKCSQLLKFEK